jgi:metallo-beta-lactamase family protein
MSAAATLQFVGGAGAVTGSKYLVRAGGRQVLLDCGLFQGLKALRLRNWAKPPFVPAEIDAVVLSHAHVDHAGYLPLLARRGFRGPVYCTPATADLLGALLPDCARIQEEDAERANRHGYSKHRPALPLYTSADAEAALRLVRRRPCGRAFPICRGITALTRRTGHILGAASVELRVGPGDPLRLVFSGDLGRWGRSVLRDPELVPEADVLLVESTYGDRTHPPDPLSELARVVNDSVTRNGALLIPAFAVDRTQELIWSLRQLEDAGRIPVLPVYVDSPLAIEVTDIYCRHPGEHRFELTALADRGRCSLRTRRLQLARTPEESKALNHVRGPLVVIAGSGMATGGRVLHHLARRLPDPATTVLLVGFQAAGTRGRSLQDGAATLRLHGQDVPVRARVESVQGLSAHADREEILRWLSGFKTPPRQTYVVHGEPGPAAALAETIRATLHWEARPAADGETVDLLRRDDAGGVAVTTASASSP